MLSLGKISTRAEMLQSARCRFRSRPNPLSDAGFERQQIIVTASPRRGTGALGKVPSIAED